MITTTAHVLDRLDARRRTNTSPHRICSRALVIAGIAFAIAGIPASALAHTASVNTVSGLKAAIISAQTDNLDDSISLTGNISFAASTDTIAINVTDGKTLSVEGGGFSLDGGNLTRVLDVVGGNVVINNLTITNGKLSGNGGYAAGTTGPGGSGGDALGAGIHNAGNLSIRNSTVTANKAAGGGAGGTSNFNEGGGGGGGGGGFGAGLGGAGGNGGYVSASGVGTPGQPASGITGGEGGSGVIDTSVQNGGKGGSATGGAGGAFSVGSNFPGSPGGTANNGTISIGGGGGGGWTRFGMGDSGKAVGAIYNTGLLTITSSAINNNIAAGGGGGDDRPSGGGEAVGGIWNAGGSLNLDTATVNSLAMGNAAAGGYYDVLSGFSFQRFSSNTLYTTGGGTTNTNYVPPTVPGAPTIGSATAGNAQASVGFTAPASNGGSAITGYTATSNPGAFTGTCTAPCATITVTGLVNGTAYSFTVTATNAVGPSAASAASNSVAPSTVPSAPSISGVTPENASVSVAFTAGFDGGAPITNFTATCGAQSQSDTSSPIIVAGLANGTPVTCFVRANNVNGNGANSANSASVTPMGSQTIIFGANPGPVTYASTGTFNVTATGGASTNPVILSVPITTTVCSVSANTVSILSAGTCIVAANQAGNASFSAALERTQSITINKASSSTAITSNLPNPSFAGDSVTVNYALTVLPPGVGTPTGDVVLSVSGGTETCTGTVAAGSCNITLTGIGTRTLTATYAGDANFNGSAGTSSHTVIALPAVSIALAPATVAEDGVTNLVYTVTRDAALASATVVNIASSGTAMAGVDYTGSLATATILSGATTATIAIDPSADSAIEADETVILTIASGTGYSVAAPASATGTITNDDGEPSFAPAGPITRQQGSPAAPATLGTVSDLTDPANSLAVAIITDTTTGVATTGLTNINGTLTASMAASCMASAGNLSLRVTDSGGLTDTDVVQINVSANTPPSLAYGAANVSVGNSLTITPSTGLSDNGTVKSMAVQSSGTYTGGISISNSGVISLSNATPAGDHTLLVRATDNCGTNTDVSVALTISQASTFKLITSNVSPSRYGEAVTFSVALSGVNPTGTVEFFAGATSLGSAALVASPSGGANLKLANLTLSTLAVGSSVIKAVYAGDVNNSAATSADLAHIVNTAGSRITLTPAANPAPVGTASIAVVVSPEAPGGGVPAGSVTLSSGALNCTALLNAGAGSCTLNFASVGYQAITASYTPTGSNHAASIGGSTVVIVATPSSTDLRVRIGNGVSNIGAGQGLSYLIVVDNLGTQAAVGRLQVPVSADFVGASYTCISAALANCGAGGSGNIDQELSLAPGGVVIYRVNVTAPLAPERLITQTASITAKTPTIDPDATNSSAEDIDPMGLLADGYEDAAVTE